MKTIVLGTSILVALVVAAIGGCYYPVPVAVAPPPAVVTTSVPASFDASWSAALGAFADQGVQVTSQDRGAGQIRGTRDGINIVANVRTQADGSVRVEFNTSGATSRDPSLIDRISSAYDRRMGR